MPTIGNVGIGTTTPSALLDINGNAVIDSSLVVKDSLEVRKKLKVNQDIKVVGKSVFVDKGKFKSDLVIDGLTKMNGDAKVFGNLKLPNLSMTTNNTVFLTTNANGKVMGLDKRKLITTLYQPIQNCLRDENGNLLPIWKQNPNPNYGILYTGVDCPARVGIGIDLPEANLHVVGNSFLKGNGTVYATRVRVMEAQNFPDYVFKSDYELMPLNQLEEYIANEKHLPNMPTAKEVEANGADLGEINRVLVEKVEELTLYMIAMDKRMKTLEEENKSLKK